MSKLFQFLYHIYFGHEQETKVFAQVDELAERTVRIVQCRCARRNQHHFLFLVCYCFDICFLAIAVASFSAYRLLRGVFLWPPYGIGQAIIFLPCGFFLLSSSSIFFLSSPNLSGRRLDVYHTSTHGVALVRI